MRFRRLLVPLVLALSAFAVPVTPASAADAYALNLTLSFDCLGCGGTHPGTLNGSLVGTANGGGLYTPGSLAGSFAATSGPTLPVTCTASVTASGTVSGALSGSVSITWTPPLGLVVVTSAHGSVWVGVAAATSINCLGVTFVQAVAWGGGVSF